MPHNRLEQLQEFLKKQPDDAFLLYAVALEYAAAGNRGRAIEQLQDLALREPSYLALYYQLGKYLEEEDRIAEAVSAYKKGIELAIAQKEQRTLSELRSALSLIDDGDDD